MLMPQSSLDLPKLCGKAQTRTGDLAHASARLLGKLGASAWVLGGKAAAATGPTLLGILRVTAGAMRPTGRKGPSRQVRQEWARQLDRLGRAEVRERLSRLGVQSPGAPVPLADAGMLRGAHRFPTLSYVEQWLDNEDDGSAEQLWRIRAWVGVGTAAAMGLTLAGLNIIA